MIMQDRIYYERPDGSVVVIIPTGEMPLDEVVKKDVPQGVRYYVSDMSHLPTGRYFRDAWEYNQPVEKTDLCVKINIDKCRNIKRDKLREDRKPLMQTLDIQYMKALESNDTVAQADIASKKQALRDVPQDPQIDQITDLDELKNYTPKIFAML